jgi:SAM-dependent methyltransferase
MGGNSIRKLASTVRHAYIRYGDYQRGKDLTDYLKGDRRPFSKGYSQARTAFIDGVLQDASLVDRFKRGHPLENGYGHGFDERVIEYPWLLSRIDSIDTRVLDAGSILNKIEILSSPILLDKRLHIVTLAPEGYFYQDRAISYVFEDIRALPYQDHWFDLVVCISTLEHIGMDTDIYTRRDASVESHEGNFTTAVHEMKRVLRPGGRLLVTVPYGAYEDLGWLQQFDAGMVHELSRAFGGDYEHIDYYQYGGSYGWQLSNAEACVDCRYADRAVGHQHVDEGPDFPAAASAVACIEARKPY